MIAAGLLSGLVAQSEMDDLLDMLYGSYGERLIVTYEMGKLKKGHGTGSAG
jgi:hypothetical protein